VARTIGRSLENIEAILLGISDQLAELITQEVEMAAEQSAEAKALDDAVAGLQAELADVGTVDGEVVVDLEGVQTAISKVNPTTVEQVNAVTAATSSLASLTSKLKATGSAAAGVEAGAGAAPAAAAPAASEPAKAEPGAFSSEPNTTSGVTTTSGGVTTTSGAPAQPAGETPGAVPPAQ
jgi:hypothetical protein